MNRTQLLEDFLVRHQMTDLEPHQKELFAEVFEAFGKALSFETMDEQQLGEVVHGFDWLATSRVVHTPDERSHLLNSIKKTRMALDVLINAQTAQAKLDLTLLKSIDFVNVELGDYESALETWSGSEPKLGKIQEIGLSILNEKLRDSLKDHASRWKNLKIPERGSFRSAKQDPEGLCPASPGGILTNLCFARKLGLTENGVENIIERRVLTNGKLQFGDD